MILHRLLLAFKEIGFTGKDFLVTKADLDTILNYYPG